MAALERDEFLTHVNYIRADLTEVNIRLDALNGRTRQTERKIAVLEDRAETICTEAKSAGRLTAGKWGAGIAALGALAELLHQYWR